jgi:hypothetical protein
MGVRILRAKSEAVLYCSTSDWAFGPVFSDDDHHDADERAEAFCRWLNRDARTLEESELQSAYSRWLAQEPMQWELEEAEANRED